MTCLPVSASKLFQDYHTLTLSLFLSLSIHLSKTKMKQLEQQAHQTAGQKFLVSSSSQLREVRVHICMSLRQAVERCLCIYTDCNASSCCQVLFEKLRLHARCENKKLPKTLLKQQQSTSEAVVHTSAQTQTTITKLQSIIYNIFLFIS